MRFTLPITSTSILITLVVFVTVCAEYLTMLYLEVKPEKLKDSGVRKKTGFSDVIPWSYWRKTNEMINGATKHQREETKPVQVTEFGSEHSIYLSLVLV